jgi:3-hydroxyacyl-[acyl-carrier-protein] dehydratase
MLLFPSLRVQDLIPHRYPFLFVDEITSTESGQGAQGMYKVPDDHPFLNCLGAESSFPSVLIIEALAQIGAIYIGVAEFINGVESPQKGYLVRIDQCTIESSVKAGERLFLTARFVKRLGSLYKFNTTADVGGRAVAKATLTIYVEP